QRARPPALAVRLAQRRRAGRGNEWPWHGSRTSWNQRNFLQAVQEKGWLVGSERQPHHATSRFGWRRRSGIPLDVAERFAVPMRDGVGRQRAVRRQWGFARRRALLSRSNAGDGDSA